MRTYVAIVLGGVCWLSTMGLAAAADDSLAAAGGDTRLKAATALVNGSDRYLHHSHLRRGMTGYGLTVMAGVERVRFNVEIVSVMTGHSPRADVILARLNGLGLQTSGIIAGMSGSPVYINHEGKDKLIGAVAYSWTYQKSFEAGPLCGIQPISQMLAVSGVDLGVEEPATPQPAAMTAKRLPSAWRERMFAAEKTDFAAFGRRSRGHRAADEAGSQMKPLVTPLMVSGMGARAMTHLVRSLGDVEMSTVRSGQVGPAAADEVVGLKLEPGAALAIPMMLGAEDVTALGTVTDVIDGVVLGFGHPMFDEGHVRYPMATGYVHSVVASVNRSMKLGATVQTVGEIRADEHFAVVGVVGPEPDMIPMSVVVEWPRGQRQRYTYRLMRERSMTVALVSTAVMDSVWGTRGLPDEHTVQYDAEVDYGPVGTYRVSNLSAGNDIYDAGSDLTRPVAAMRQSQFGSAPIHSIATTIRISEGTRAARILAATLDRNHYAPGDEVTATVQLEQYQGERFTRTIEVRLPDDLPEGEYPLSVGDWRLAQRGLQKRRPRLFDPRDLRQLLAAVQASTETRTDRLYAQLELPEGGLTVGVQPIADAPPTVAAILTEAKPLEVKATVHALTADVEIGLVVSGTTQATVTVTRRPPRP